MNSSEGELIYAIKMFVLIAIHIANDKISLSDVLLRRDFIMAYIGNLVIENFDV